jgi:maleylacetoacetate isomerase
MKFSLYHYWRSSCSWRVRWALALKGVSYDSVPVNLLAGEQTNAGYTEKNPACFVPAVEIDGRYFGESLAILEWIEETWPTPALLPKAPLDRLLVRQMALTVVAGTQPLQNLATLKYFAPDEAARKPHAQYWIGRGLKTLEKLIVQANKGGPFAFGQDPTFADLCLVPQVYNALRFDVDLSAVPKCQAIYEHALKTPACDAAAPHNQPGAK